MRMIDTGQKHDTEREAVVEGRVILKPSTALAVKKRQLPKGDAIEAARLAGILAAKKTPQLIPLCHPIGIDYVDIGFSFARGGVKIRAVVRGRAKTGVEMEAFAAASMAALTIYDMCKAVDRGIVISDIRLIKKSGGKSGTYIRKD